MKKIISVLFLALTLTLFSSCIIVTEPEHTLTFTNNHPTYNVFDWYVRDRNGNTYEPNSKHDPVYRGRSRSIDLKEGTYCIVFSFDDTTDNSKPLTFFETDEIYLYSNKEFILTTTSLKDCSSFVYYPDD